MTNSPREPDGAGQQPTPDTTDTPPAPWSAPPPVGDWSPQPSSGGRWPALIVVGICVLVLVAGGAAAYWAFAPGTGGGAASHGTEAAPGGGRLSQSAYGNWRFRLGNVALSADKTGGRDFATCGPLERKRSMTRQGCEYGIELNYTADHDRIRFLHMIMVFDSTRHATLARKDLTQDDLALDQKALYPTAVTKAARWTRDSANEYLVVTACATTSSADVKQVDTYLHYANADETNALLWRD